MSVLIIGAGIAGLSAGYHLMNMDPAKNIAIQVFEARSEVGGRIRKIPEDEAPPFLEGLDVDMGAQDFFYFDDKTSYKNLLVGEDIETFADEFNFAVWPNRFKEEEQIPAFTFKKLEKKTSKLCNKVDCEKMVSFAPQILETHQTMNIHPLPMQVLPPSSTDSYTRPLTTRCGWKHPLLKSITKEKTRFVL